MPITENNFTDVELTAALTANKDALMPVITKVLASDDFKFVVQDPNQHKEFLTNHEKLVADKVTLKHATDLEKDVLELTGINKKDPNEKYYDYFKRATSEKLATVNALQQEVNTLKDKSNPSAADQARIKQLEAAIEKTNNDRKVELSAKDKKIHELTVGNHIGSVLAGIRQSYRKDLPADLVTLAEQNTIAKLTAMAKVKDDNTIEFLQADGTVALDQTTMKPLKAEDLVKSELKSLIDAGRQQQGAGSGTPGSGATGEPAGAAGAKVEITSIPADVKTKIGLSEYLMKMGYTDLDPKFTTYMDQFGKNLPLR